jgi:hypothetical protein
MVASVDTFNCGVVQYAIPSQTFDKQLITRIDYTLNPKNHMYGRYLFDGYQFPAYFFSDQHPAHYAIGKPATAGPDRSRWARTTRSTGTR